MGLSEFRREKKLQENSTKSGMFLWKCAKIHRIRKKKTSFQRSSKIRWFCARIGCHNIWDNRICDRKNSRLFERKCYVFFACFFLFASCANRHRINKRIASSFRLRHIANADLCHHRDRCPESNNNITIKIRDLLFSFKIIALEKVMI